MKNKVRLTESQLHRIIKESVRKVLREGYTQFDEDKAITDTIYWNDYDYNPLSHEGYISLDFMNFEGEVPPPPLRLNFEVDRQGEIWLESGRLSIQDKQAVKNFLKQQIGY